MQQSCVKEPTRWFTAGFIRSSGQDGANSAGETASTHQSSDSENAEESRMLCGSNVLDSEDSSAKRTASSGAGDDEAALLAPACWKVAQGEKASILL